MVQPVCKDFGMNVPLLFWTSHWPRTSHHFQPVLPHPTRPWYFLPSSPPFVSHVLPQFPLEIKQRVSAEVGSSEQSMDIDAPASCVSMYVDDCRPRQRRTKNNHSLPSHQKTAVHRSDNMDYFPVQSTSKYNSETHCKQPCVSNTHVVVAVDQILDGVDFDKMTMNMVYRTLLSKFPLVYVEPRKPFNQATVQRIMNSHPPDIIYSSSRSFKDKSCLG